MKRHTQLISRLKDKRGVTAIMVALMGFVLVGLGALTVDIGHLCMARNQLKNAADAGALAGARALFNADNSINSGANQIAIDAATANVTEGPTGPPVEVNAEEVERGHWSFATGQFTPNDSLTQVDIWGKSFAELDLDTALINAVRVNTRRQGTPVASFFARILGDYTGFNMSLYGGSRDSRSIAWLGFAGSFEPGELNQPIAICREAIVDPNTKAYDCSKARMISSGLANHQTGGWTDFNQEDAPCQGGTNAPTVRSLVCGEGNPDTLIWNGDMATSGGQIQSAFNDFFHCWEQERGDPPQPWNMTLPVVLCPGNNVGTCEKLSGAVNVNVIWVNVQTDPQYRDAPTQMGDWSYAADEGNTNGFLRWKSFVDYFKITDVLGPDPPFGTDQEYADLYQSHAIYFLPDCTPHDPTGGSGGGAYGVFAKIPKLVQ